VAEIVEDVVDSEAVEVVIVEAEAALLQEEVTEEEEVVAEEHQEEVEGHLGAAVVHEEVLERKEGLRQLLNPIVTQESSSQEARRICWSPRTSPPESPSTARSASASRTPQLPTLMELPL
jgi:hypothetical protein